MMPVRSDVQVEALRTPVLQLREEHRRHAVERGAALTIDRLEHALRIERFHGHSAGAVRVRAEHADHAAEAVKQRHAQAQPIVRRVAEHARPARSRC